MKLQDICVSLELAKQLKEAGYPQDSLFYWKVDKDVVRLGELGSEAKTTELFSAPTSAELGEKLANQILVDKKPYYFEEIIGSTLGKRNYWVSYSNMGEVIREFFDDAEADARAKMWLYLKEKGVNLTTAAYR